MTRTYLDHNATTPTSQAVLDAMTTALAVTGNPTAQHADGRAANAIISNAREAVGLAMGVCTYLWPSKIYGHWELEHLVGLEEAFEAEDKKFAARQEKIIWGYDHSKITFPMKISYKFNPITYTTSINLLACNAHRSRYRGMLRKRFDDIRFLSFNPPKALACTSPVETLSGEERPRHAPSGPSAIDLTVKTYAEAMSNSEGFRVSNRRQTLIFFDANQNEIARFKRMEAGQ